MKLFLKLHKITGSLLSLMFVIWFASGIVLIFHGFPHASRKDRFMHLQTFTSRQLANLQAPSSDFKGKITLELAYGKPVYRVSKGRRAEDVFGAQTLAPVTSFTKDQAEQLAADFTHSTVKDTTMQDDLSQWIPWSYYEPLLPFYKCTINDKAHTVLYISEKTGAIVQQTTLKSRVWAYLGAIPHWIYLVQLRRHVTAWRWLMIALASGGVVVSLTGIVVGIYRKKKKGITPYKKFWFKWHHWFGYFFGVFIFTFILSGLFSILTVPNWLAGVNSNKTVAIQWDKAAPAIKAKNLTPQEILQAVEKKEGVRKIEWQTIFNIPAYFIYYDDYRHPEIYLSIKDQVKKHSGFSVDEINHRATSLFSELSPRVIVQQQYDSYYYDSKMFYRPLPVYKIECNDARKTWLYIDPATGKKISKMTRNSRLRRWLYKGLHTFNFPFLQKHETLRITLLLVISISGLIVSISGLVLSKRFFKQGNISPR